MLAEPGLFGSAQAGAAALEIVKAVLAGTVALGALWFIGRKVMGPLRRKHLFRPWRDVLIAPVWVAEEPDPEQHPLTDLFRWGFYMGGTARLGDRPVEFRLPERRVRLILNKHPLPYSWLMKTHHAPAPEGTSIRVSTNWAEVTFERMERLAEDSVAALAYIEGLEAIDPQLIAKRWLEDGGVPTTREDDQVLRVLISIETDDAMLRPAYERVPSEAYPELRLLAAERLGDPERLVALVEDQKVAPLAFSRLEEIDPERACAAAITLLRKQVRSGESLRPKELAPRLLRSALSGGGEPARIVVGDLLLHREPQLAVQALKALVASPNEATATTILQMLATRGHENEESLLYEAIVGLGEVGDRDTATRLLAWSETTAMSRELSEALARVIAGLNRSDPTS